MTTKCGHLRPQNLIFTDRANKTSTVHGVTCDHRMRSLTTTKHFHNRTAEGGGVGGGGEGGMIAYLGLHTDTLKGGLVCRLSLPPVLLCTTPVLLLTKHCAPKNPMFDICLYPKQCRIFRNQRYDIPWKKQLDPIPLCWIGWLIGIPKINRL